jgi:hypothetical protein
MKHFRATNCADVQAAANFHSGFLRYEDADRFPVCFLLEKISLPKRRHAAPEMLMRTGGFKRENEKLH